MPRESTNNLSRVISFRISEEDYKVLLDSQQEINAGSPSEAAREIISVFLRTGGDFQKLGLAKSLWKVEEDMTELRGKLRTFQGDRRGE